MAEETEAELKIRMARISAAGHRPNTMVNAHGTSSAITATFDAMPMATNPLSTQIVLPPVTPKQTEPRLSEEEAELKAEKAVGVIDRRAAQGLAFHPFPDKLTLGFVKLGEDNKPFATSIKDVQRLVSGWFVKKDNKFHDVNNLQTTYQAQDLKQVIVSRIKVMFPKLELTNKDLERVLLSVLLDPPIANANPERNIPVWSGHTVSLPTNTQKISFRDGVATVNLWEYPAYRRTEERKRDRLRCFPFLCHSQRSRACCVPELACLVAEARRTEASLGCDAVQPETRYW